MKIVIIAELLLGLLANGIRFYANKRYIDFFASKDKCRWKNMWILYVVACFLTYVVSISLVSTNWNVFANILALILLIFPYQIKLIEKILMVFAIYVINALVDIIVVQLLTRYVPGQPVQQVYLLIISLIILMTTAFLRKPQDKDKDASLPYMSEFALGIIPLISIACMHCTAILTSDNKIVVLTVAFSLIFINAFWFYLYHMLTNFYAAKINEKRLEQIVDVYAHQLDVIQESQEHIKNLRHDMRHHIIELSAMAKQDENQEMIRYLKQMEKFMLNPEEKVSTGNREIDGVLNYMLLRADDLLNTVNIDIQIPKELYSKNFNTCVILGNLVDNAIREANKSEEKFLSISIRTQKDLLLILVENSYIGTISKKDDKFQTSQGNANAHGVGLESVKKVVASCGGDMKIEYTDKRFRVQILLYLSNVM